MKKTFNIFARSIAILFPMDLVYILSTVFLLSFFAEKIRNHALLISSTLPLINEMQGLAKEEIDINQLNSYLDVIDNSARSITVLAIAAIVLAYVLFCFFQSVQFRLAYRSLKERIGVDNILHNILGYFAKFLVVNIPLVILAFGLFYKPGSSFFYILVALLVFFLYLMFSINALLITRGIGMAVKDGFRLSLKAGHKLFPAYLAFIATLALVRVVPMLFFLLVFILALNLYRTFVAASLEK